MEPFNHQTTDSHRLRHSNVTIISVSWAVLVEKIEAVVAA